MNEFSELLGEAIRNLQQSRTAEAETQCRRALYLFPRDPDALSILGMVLHFEKRLHEAEEIFEQLTELVPTDAAHWANLGSTRRCAKRFDAALAAYAKAVELGASSASFYLDVALTHLDRGDAYSARALLRQATALDPTSGEIRYRLALACYNCFDSTQALQALDGIESCADVTPDLLASHGLLLLHLGEPVRARAALTKAALAPRHSPALRLTLAQSFERMNLIGQARSCLETLRGDPAAQNLGHELLSMRAQLAARESLHAEAVELFQQALSEAEEEAARHTLLFPLAQSLDALGRYDDAFTVLEDAHRSQATYLRQIEPAIRFRGVPSVAVADYLCTHVDAAQWQDAEAPPVEASPIFIVGFPRSGTTLLEMMLDAHTQIVSMDEQPFLQAALEELQATGAGYPDRMAGLTSRQLGEIRGSYWQRVRTKVALRDGQRLVDKNPLNILRLPAIRRIFPRASIILAVRHPCDVVLSCFMQHFRAHDFALLCGSLASLAAAYRRTFDSWYEQERILGCRAYELRYEEFVHDARAGARNVLSFLGLPWDSKVLEPHSNAQKKGYISTPSYAQVVQPVNGKSVGRWHRYRARLDPVLPLLQPYLSRWQYDS